MTAKTPVLGDAQNRVLSDGDPVTRLALRRAWGMCPRHSFAYLSVDAAFRRGFLHGPAILYEDLMDRGTAALRVRGPLRGRPLARSLRTVGPCHMCSMGYGPASRGWTTGDILERGRDLGEIRVFALATEPGWRPDVYGRCSGDGSPARCRPHLVEDLRAGQQVADLARTWVARVHARVRGPWLELMRQAR